MLFMVYFCFLWKFKNKAKLTLKSNAKWPLKNKAEIALKNKAIIAKSDRLSDRISTASAATEKSHENQSKNKNTLLDDIEIMNSKLEVKQDFVSANKPHVLSKSFSDDDDLVFYDLEEEDKNKVVGSTMLNKLEAAKLIRSNVSTQKPSVKKQSLVI